MTTRSMPMVGGETATIAANKVESNVVDLRGGSLCALLVPAAMSNTTITFKAGVVPATMLPVHDTTNSAVSITCGTAEAAFYPLDPANFVGARYVQVVSGGTEVAERVFTLGVRAL